MMKKKQKLRQDLIDSILFLKMEMWYFLPSLNFWTCVPEGEATAVMIIID